jgi:flagellar protein FliS
MAHPLAAYRATQIAAATPAERVVMLYEGAIRFATASIEAMGRNDRPAAHAASLRAQDIVGELRATLDLSAGEMAARLDAIYDFTAERLIVGNLRRDPAAVREAVDTLAGLLPAWKSIAGVQPSAEE